jgi:hypothetical protein
MKGANLVLSDLGKHSAEFVIEVDSAKMALPDRLANFRWIAAALHRHALGVCFRNWLGVDGATRLGDFRDVVALTFDRDQEVRPVVNSVLLPLEKVAV